MDGSRVMLTPNLPGLPAMSLRVSRIASRSASGLGCVSAVRMPRPPPRATADASCGTLLSALLRCYPPNPLHATLDDGVLEAEDASEFCSKRHCGGKWAEDRAERESCMYTRSWTQPGYASAAIRRRRMAAATVSAVISPSLSIRRAKVHRMPILYLIGMRHSTP